MVGQIIQNDLKLMFVAARPSLSRFFALLIWSDRHLG